MKRKKYEINLEEFDELKDMGYEVKQFSPIHFRVSYFGKPYDLDIYPTRHSYLKHYKDGYQTHKDYYDNLIELVETKLDLS